MGLIGNTCFKGTPGVLKHYSGLPMANPGGPLNKSTSVLKGPCLQCTLNIEFAFRTDKSLYTQQQVYTLLPHHI